MALPKQSRYCFGGVNATYIYALRKLDGRFGLGIRFQSWTTGLPPSPTRRLGGSGVTLNLLLLLEDGLFLVLLLEDDTVLLVHQALLTVAT